MRFPSNAPKAYRIRNTLIYCQIPCWKSCCPGLRISLSDPGLSRPLSGTCTARKATDKVQNTLSNLIRNQEPGPVSAKHRTQRIRGDVDEYIGRFCDSLTRENIDEKIGELITMEVPLGKSLKAEDLRTAGWQLGGTKPEPARPVAVLEKLYSDQDLLTNPNYIRQAPSKPFVTPRTPLNSDSQDLRGVAANVLTEMRIQSKAIALSKDGCASVQFYPPWDVIANMRTSRPGIVVRTTKSAKAVPTVFNGGPGDRKLPAFHHAIQRKLTTTMVKRGFMKAWKEISADPPDGLYVVTMRAQKLDSEWSYDLFKEVFRKVKLDYTKFERNNTVQQLLRCKHNKTIPSKFYCQKEDWIKPDGKPVHEFPHNIPVTRDCRHWWSYYCLGEKSPPVLRAIERNKVPTKAAAFRRIKPKKLEHSEMTARLRDCIKTFVCR